jgi:two-component system, LytTR family, response regulator
MRRNAWSRRRRPVSLRTTSSPSWSSSTSIPLASLERVQGADDYVTLCTTTREYLVSIRLTDLEERLRKASFLRIHRSHLINLEQVASIEPYDVGRVQVVMKSATKIVASRAGSRRLRDLAL